MKTNLDKRHLTISVILTSILQSLYCYPIIFFDTSDNLDFNLKIVAIFYLLISIILISFKDVKTKSIGYGILYGSILTIIVFAIIVLFALFNAFGNYNDMSK